MKRNSLLIVLLLCLLSLSASAAEFHLINADVNSGLTGVSNATTTAGTAFAIPPNTPILIQCSFSSTGTDTTTNAVGIDLSGVGGTNWSTVQPITSSAATSGTNVIVTHTTVTAAQLVGATMGKVTTLTHAVTNVLTVNWVRISYYY